MNPITWLFIVAPAAVLAAVLFVWVYQDTTDRGEEMRQQQKLERMEFDRNFANAWNGERIEAPGDDEIEAQRQKLAAIEKAKQARDLERCRKLAELAGQLETTIKGSEALPTECKEIAQ